MVRTRLPSLLVLLVVSGGASAAQGAAHPPGPTPVWLDAVPGLLPSGGFGADVAVLGDLDGDGIGEWMAGRNGPPSGARPPQLRVYSGGTGALLYAVRGLGRIDPIFLEALVDLGDLDGDGVDDFCFANANAPRGTVANVGAVVVYSGATGAELYTRWGVGNFHGFGASVAALGDVDGDTVPDFVAGAIGTLDENVWVVSGAGGDLLFNVQGPRRIGDIEFGWATAGLDDVDGDGAPDFAVGTRTGGFVDAYSGRDGARLWRVRGGTSFGRRLATLGDLDGDGLRDLLVGEPEANRVHVVSGARPTKLLVLEAPDGESFGAALACAGDVDRDGLPDLLVGDPDHDGRRGRAQVFSGRHGRLLLEVVGEQPGDLLGSGVAGGIDVDANGWPDLVLGAPGVDRESTDVGEVSLWSSWPASPAGHAGSAAR